MARFGVMSLLLSMLTVGLLTEASLPTAAIHLLDRHAEDQFYVQQQAMPAFRGRRTAASNDSDNACLYVASLKAATSSGSVGIKGSVIAYNETGHIVSTFSSRPLAVAVDSGKNLLFVTTPTSIQEYNIVANLESGDKSCTCSFSTLGTGDDVIQTMSVDELSERLYFATETNVCYRLIGKSSNITCRSYNISGNTFNELRIPPGSNQMYITANEIAAVYVISIKRDSTNLDLLAVWTPTNTSNKAFIGISTGFSDNVFLLAYVEVGQPCAVMEMSSRNGSLVSCFSPPAATQSFFKSIYGLIYNNDTGVFYTYISASASNYTHNSTSIDTYDVQLFDLRPSATAGQMENTFIDYLVSGITSPVDTIASPSPEAVSVSSNVDTLAIVLPTALGSLLLLILACMAIACACVMAAKRRRKYYDGARECDAEAGIEMSTVKFTFREIDGQDLRLGKLLGEGAFGKVYKGEYRGAVVAVKMFEALRLDQADEKVLGELRMEAQMMERLSNHPNIVKFVGAITKGNEGTNFALVTEFCPRGSLFDLLVKGKKKLPLITLVRMARDAASGILHLHKEQIVHRDIATRNILVGQNYEVYVSDFGLARTHEANVQVSTTKQNFGPLAWMAPEALKSRHYSEATDAFSFGVLLCERMLIHNECTTNREMMVRKRPWAGVDPVQIISAVTTNTRLRIPKDCDPIFAQLMKACWRQNPTHRPTFEKVAEVLSNYYKKLHKLHDVSAVDVFEMSEQESQEESDDEMALEGLSYEEWQMKRIKDEVKSFMKQLITERNDDFDLVARANTAAFTELKEAFDSAANEESRGDDRSDDDDGSYQQQGHEENDECDLYNNDSDDDERENDRDVRFAWSGDRALATASGEARGGEAEPNYIKVLAPKNAESARTITYAQAGGRRPSTDSETSAEPKGLSLSDIYVEVGQSSASQSGTPPASPRQSDSGSKKRTKRKPHKKATNGPRDSASPPPPQPQQPKSTAFDETYVSLRTGSEPQITAKVRKESESEKRDTNGYEEVTTPAAAAAATAPAPAPVVRSQDADYFAV